jgi:thiamine-phosphate pyrophosphorylase
MIIAVTDRKISATPNFTDRVEAIASSRPDMLILREKDLSEKEYGRLAAECARICGRYGVKFCVNSFTAAAEDAGGMRIQMPYASFTGGGTPRFKEIWVSVHSAGEAAEAERLGATHLIFGNVFETSCKPGAEGKGTEELARVCASANVPVFAIGGIDEDTVSKAMDAGCAGVCVRGLLMTSADPKAVMEGLRKKIKGAKPPFKG